MSICSSYCFTATIQLVDDVRSEELCGGDALNCSDHFTDQNMSKTVYIMAFSQFLCL